MKKQPLKEKLKQIGGGHLLNESHAWERKFGEPLPTLASVQKKHENKVNEGPVKLGIPVMVNVGFSKEMGTLYVSKGSGKSVELRKADVEEIIKQYKKFKSKMD
jgi:hypothetical protein